MLLVSFNPCSNALHTGLLSVIVLLANLATFSALMSYPHVSYFFENKHASGVPTYPNPITPILNSKDLLIIYYILFMFYNVISFIGSSLLCVRYSK